MNLDLGLVDLSSVVAMVIASGVTLNVLSFARTTFLDALLRGMSSTQRDYALRLLSYLLNFAAILAFALLAAHLPLSLHLLVSVAFYAGGGFGITHASYHMALNTKKTSESLYAEIPPDAGAVSPLPEPPTDDPQSAALAA